MQYQHTGKKDRLCTVRDASVKDVLDVRVDNAIVVYFLAKFVFFLGIGDQY